MRFNMISQNYTASSFETHQRVWSDLKLHSKLRQHCQHITRNHHSTLTTTVNHAENKNRNRLGRGRNGWCIPHFQIRYVFPFHVTVLFINTHLSWNQANERCLHPPPLDRHSKWSTSDIYAHPHSSITHFRQVAPTTLVMYRYFPKSSCFFRPLPRPSQPLPCYKLTSVGKTVTTGIFTYTNLL